MYKIIAIETHCYPHVLLHLLNITTGVKRWWCFSELHADELCKDYHVKDLKGVILDNVPAKGSWIKQSEINKI